MGPGFDCISIHNGPRCWVLLFWLASVRCYLELTGKIWLRHCIRRKNALSMIYVSMMTIAVVSFQVSQLPTNKMT